MQIDMSPSSGRVISRKKIDVSEYSLGGRKAKAASVIRTDNGYNAVLLVEGQPPIVRTGLKGPKAAEQQIYQLLDDVLPDFLGGPLQTPLQPKPRKSRAQAQISETHNKGHTPRHHGSVEYVITGETEGQILHQVRKLNRWYQGYGVQFGELETIDGVLTIHGRRSDNCE